MKHYTIHEVVILALAFAICIYALVLLPPVRCHLGNRCHLDIVLHGTYI